MEHMEGIFPYLWLLNAQTNSLLEPNELTRQLLDGAEEFQAKLAGLTGEELEYVRRDMASALAYLGETRALLEQLESILRETGGGQDGI